MQSELSYCNLEEEGAPPPDVLKYKQEIEAHNVFDSVLESPTKNRRKSLQDTPIDEILVSVTSWSDAKGHTDYVISTSVIGCAFVTTSRRFSDFITLHSRICAPLGLVEQFPVPKTPFVTESVKRSRMRALQGYLRHACAAAAKRAGPPSEGAAAEVGPGAELPLALSEFLGFEVLAEMIAKAAAETAATEAAAAEAAEAAAAAAAAAEATAAEAAAAAKLAAAAAPPASAAAPLERAHSPVTIMASPKRAGAASRPSSPSSPATPTTPTTPTTPEMDADMPPWLRRAEERLQSGTGGVARVTSTLAQLTAPSSRESARATEVTPPRSPAAPAGTPTPAPAPAPRTGATEHGGSPVRLGLGAKGGVAQVAAVQAPTRLGMVAAGAGVALAVLGVMMSLAGDAEAAGPMAG